MTKTAIAAMLALCILAMPLREASASEWQTVGETGWKTRSASDPATDDHAAVVMLKSARLDGARLGIFCEGGELAVRIVYDRRAEDPVRLGNLVVGVQGLGYQAGPWRTGAQHLLVTDSPGVFLSYLSQAERRTLYIDGKRESGECWQTIFDITGIEAALDVIAEAGCTEGFFR